VTRFYLFLLRLLAFFLTVLLAFFLAGFRFAARFFEVRFFAVFFAMI